MRSADIMKGFMLFALATVLKHRLGDPAPTIAARAKKAVLKIGWRLRSARQSGCGSC
jgi:hypothetical protein